MPLIPKKFFFDFKSIRFWLAFFFIIRLIGITNPPLERGHDWRQCLTNMISRNFYETDNNPFFPRVDNGGKHDGIIASEFPVFNYSVYLVSVPFGYDHWYGRLINLILSTIAAWYFFKLLRHYFTESIAFNATFLLTVSIWFGFSRKSMPDTFSMSLMIIALYHAYSFTRNYQWWRLATFGILGGLAVLAKLPAIYALSVLGLPILSKNIKPLPKFSILVVGAFIFSIAYWWYFVWGEYLFRTWWYQLFFPKTFKEAGTEFLPYLDKAFEKFYFSAFQGFIAFGIFLLGVFFCFKKKQHLPLWILAITFPVFLAFMVKTGNVFAFHNYYVIPFVPVMAILVAVGLNFLPLKIYPWLLAAMTIESIANQQNDFFIKDSEKFKLTLEDQVNKIVPKGEKIAITGTTGPQYLYFAHRRGWGLSPEQTLDSSYMHYVNEYNYKYLVVVKKELSTSPNYKLIGEEKDILVYDMSLSPSYKSNP